MPPEPVLPDQSTRGVTASERRRERLRLAREDANRDARRRLANEAATVRGCPAFVEQPCPTCEAGELRARGDGAIVCAMCGVNRGPMHATLQSSMRLKRGRMADLFAESVGKRV